MCNIQVVDIRNYACRGMNLMVRSGELVALVGPNGAGKSTLLNVIAGLVDYEGSVRFDGRAVDPIPARLRNVGYVFQDLALFAHLSVEKNVGYGLACRGWSKRAIRARVAEVSEWLGVSSLLKRPPQQLSGGEQQRVALARALAPAPRVLLLDEPFSSLDAASRSSIRLHLGRILRELATTTLLVTHDLDEAASVSDRVVEVNEGRLRPPPSLRCVGGGTAA